MSCNCKQEHAEKLDFTALDRILEKYDGIDGSLISILQDAQEAYGYIPASMIQYISAKTGYKEAKIFGVATFYAQFRMEPIGKYLIMLCKGTACHVNGADGIETVLNEELGIQDGETTPDGLFTMENVACLGCCSLSPVMMINDETHGSLTPEKARQIIRSIKAKEAAE